MRLERPIRTVRRFRIEKSDLLLTVAFHTLGCKVNQYDSEAMLEAFQNAGYTAVSFSDKADVYVVNTCTVTGTGDKKSLQLSRRCLRLHPESQLIVAGCLAQRMGKELLKMGARLVIGTQNRSQVVKLYEKAMAENLRICAVSALENAVYEPLTVLAQEERTRATLKIQEGCDRFCTYCIIPSVRGPIRSRPLDDVVKEAKTLSENGYPELVLTGIHLSSYGRDLTENVDLSDVITALNRLPHVKRIRLGSLEPNLITEAFMQKISQCEKLCPQFHPALQSGCDTVLHRMGRRYNITMFEKAVQHIRNAYPHAALTTDIIAGFPGETEEEHQATLETLKKIGFAKVHVFPYSIREGTKAASFPGQLEKRVKERRAHEIAAIGEESAEIYRQSFIGKTCPVLFETPQEGYTPEYIRVEAANGVAGQIQDVIITKTIQDGLYGERSNKNERLLIL
jgi:MiaB-like tRNA modifying enzyme